MKLRAIRLYNVKRFAGRGIAIDNIGDGVNVLTAANEFGKSTAFEALHALFFQPHSGMPNAVKLLRPYAGGSPLVEADIETAEGRYRLTKQFHGGKFARVTELGSNRLVAQADEAEAFIAGLTRGGAGGPAGLLWVRQGLTGLEKRSSSEEESDRRVRETLLSSVQGEVEALTGGRRMTEIVSACEEELSRLVTSTMKPKTGGPYAAAIEERDRLHALERQLSTDVTALRDALDRRRDATRRLAEIEAPEEVEAREKAIRAAEENYQTARTHGETLRAAEADLALASEQHRAATTALEQFASAMMRAEQIGQQALAAVEALEQARAMHAATLAERDRLQAAVQSAEADERQARDDKNRLDAAAAAQEASERYGAAKAALTEAEAIRGRVEAGEAQLAALNVPEQALARLEALDLELARLRAIQSASLPSLLIDYADPSDRTILLSGAPLPHGVEQGFTGSVTLDIAAIGRLTIRSQHVDDAAQAIAGAEDKSRALLAGMGIGSLAEARQRQSAAREVSGTLALDRQLLRQAAPDGMDALRQTVVRLDAKRSAVLEIKFDPSAIAERLVVAEAQVMTSRHEARQAQASAAAAHEAFVSAHSMHANLQAELRLLEGTLGPEQSRGDKHKQGLDAVRLTQNRVETCQAVVDPLRLKSENLAMAEVSLKRLRAVAQAAAQEAAQNKETLADLNGQIRIQTDKAIEELWQETADQLAAATAKTRRYELEVRTLDRLRKALATARSSARDLYLKPVMTELRPLIGLLFDDVAVTFNEETLLPESVLRNGQEEEVDRLSGGMREQLSVLTRLAFARLLARDGRAAPVILDDALVYSDDARIERMFEALHRQSQDQQILVFSCRQRAFSRLGGNVLTTRDWTPA